jgi:DNA-binding GntR family transcriptional regulator
MNPRSRVIVERGSSTDAAYLAIREMIVHGRLAPGSWIAESDLTTVLKMSRTPIRAASQWLQHEGYILERGTRAKSRMIVAPLTLKDARELYEIVGRIEGLAGRHISELSAKPRTRLTATLRTLNAELLKIAKSSNPEPASFADTDTAFHERIAEACAGPRLLAIYNAIKPQTDRYWRLYSSSLTGDMTTSWREHEAIIEAVSEGDGEGTERALQVNWENGAGRLMQAIIKFGERGTW